MREGGLGGSGHPDLQRTNHGDDAATSHRQMPGQNSDGTDPVLSDGPRGAGGSPGPAGSRKILQVRLPGELPRNPFAGLVMP